MRNVPHTNTDDILAPKPVHNAQGSYAAFVTITDKMGITGWQIELPTGKWNHPQWCEQQNNKTELSSQKHDLECQSSDIA